ncbi:MAG: type II toxin-antitoxin system HicA family toxin [Miltoncostaeaceae bacterium]
MPPTYREVRHALRAAGWAPTRQRGSHEVWVSPGGRSRVTVAGKDSTTVMRGTLAAIRRQTGLEDLR